MKQTTYTYDEKELEGAIKLVAEYLKIHKSMPQFTYPSSTGLLSIQSSYDAPFYALDRISKNKPRHWDNSDIKCIFAAQKAIKEYLKEK